MPSKLHESASVWLNEMIMKARMRGIIPQVWAEIIEISPSPEYNNFVGNYTASVMVADLTLVPIVGPERE
ncbi:hypothetical protein L873DRAFT_1822352 [Choiromyces venosus 120613-1]|uniref:Uncharacterized protein n=1 Tax=Choiromyces venosus 120613-1 TaxID=1336337 RepID=A0A3N4IU42_9PEZI|nr:hypothetical protein L873DRAFT_1822352 [Choiromyces venosus 120613-1]